MSEREKIYREILEKLKQPFPKGTIKNRKNNNGIYIPAQKYEERLEEVAGMHWSWFINGEPIIYEHEIMVKGTLQIVDAKREGIGFASFQRFPEGKIKHLNYVIRAAAQDALRDACDHFQMGWVDLGKISSSSKDRQKIDNAARCMVCKEQLIEKEIIFLRSNQIKFHYCQSHLPKHLIKNDT